MKEIQKRQTRSGRHGAAFSGFWSRKQFFFFLLSALLLVPAAGSRLSVREGRRPLYRQTRGRGRGDPRQNPSAYRCPGTIFQVQRGQPGLGQSARVSPRRTELRPPSGNQARAFLAKGPLFILLRNRGPRPPERRPEPHPGDRAQCLGHRHQGRQGNDPLTPARFRWPKRWAPRS